MKAFRLILCLIAVLAFSGAQAQMPMLLIKQTAGAPPFAPTDIAGCKLWLKADSLSLSDTDPVSTWTDSSGNGHDATGSSTARPLYRTGVINGLPALRFDGSNDILSTSYVLPSAYTVFLVYNRTTNCPIGGVSGGSNLWRSGFLWSDVSQPTATVSTSPYTGAWSYFAVTYAGRTNGAWLNGTSILSGIAGASSNTTAASVFGSSFDGFSSCDIAEVIFYDSTLGTTDRQSVEAYLHTKYGI